MFYEEVYKSIGTLYVSNSYIGYKNDPTFLKQRCINSVLRQAPPQPPFPPPPPPHTHNNAKYLDLSQNIPIDFGGCFRRGKSVISI